jgi:multiple sugar transport system permease protein
VTSRRAGARHRPATGVTVAVRLTVLAAVAIVCLVPIAWLVLAPTKTAADLNNKAPLAVGSLHNVVRAWNHVTAYQHGIIYTWIWNSAWYTGVTILIATLTALMAGYALATCRMFGRKVILVATLVSIVVPPAALVLPLFLEINAVHLTNTAASVILPASVYPFGVYLAFVYFSSNLPTGILDAARVDGCHEFYLFTRIALPLARPLIAMLFFFSFVGSWSNYFLPYILLSDQSKFPLQVGLGTMIAGTPALNPLMGASYSQIQRPEIALAGLITIAPILLLFVFAQRFLVRGILAGSIKS